MHRNSVATVTTINASVRQTIAFVEYHLRRGVDHMFLYFDDPQDASIPNLRTKESVTCISCDESHWQGRNVGSGSSVQAKQMTNATEAFRRARKSGFEWLVHIDSDELLYAEKPLPCLFADAPEVDVLVFPTKEAVPQQFEYNHPFRQISLFKYNPLGYLLQENSHGGYFDREWRKFAVRVWQYKNRLVKKIGYDHPTFLDSLLLGHTNGKAATRTSSPVVKIGNHRPQAMTNHTLNVHSLRQGGLLHFDCMGYEQWCKKWIARLDGTANFDTERFRPDRKQVLKMFGSARVGGEKDIRSLYERMYFLSPSEKVVLKSLGFIERICLSERFFEKASESPSSERTG